MSYDIRLHVKAEGCDAYPVIATPEYDSPTYNLRDMFVACMDWDYSQSEEGEDGEYHTVYYPCDFVLEKVNQGITELICHRKEYLQYNPENGWGDLDGALEVLKSLRKCIEDTTNPIWEDSIPLNCLYMSW